MPRPRIDPEIVKEIESIWAEDPVGQSARKVHREYCRRKGRGKVSERKVQQIVAAARKRARTDRSFPLVEWEPWADPTASAEDIDHLLQLDAVCVVSYRRHLHQHEAAWGRRLRAALRGLSPRGQLAIVREYGRRESLAYFLDEQPDTADLDGLVAYKPWLPEHYAFYHYAVITESTPSLRGKALWELIERPEMYMEADPALPELTRLGYLPGTWFLSGMNFNAPVPEGYDSRGSSFANFDDFKKWLLLTLHEFWAGRPPSHGIVATEGDSDERLHPQAEREVMGTDHRLGTG